MSRPAAAVVVGATLAAVGLVAGPAEAAFPGANGRLVVQRPAGEHLDLHTIAPDGSDERALRTTARIEEEATWSPDGRRLAFAQSPPSGFPTEIWTMDAEGGDLRRVTRFGSIATAPSWLPSGERLLFFTTRDFPAPKPDGPPPPAELYAAGTDGSALQRLTRDRRIQTDPVVSPDGTTIAYDQWRAVPGRPGQYDMAIHLRDVDGTHPRPLTRHSSVRDTFNASWSPDGRFIVFEVARARPGHVGGERQSDLAIVRADGTGERRLTFSDAFETNPVWSPDGRSIAFTSDLHRKRGRRVPGGADFELYTIAVDGIQLRRLTRNRVPDLKPNWQPLP
ncbi:PD40 domain-containing protein [Conexibacter sp. SYSU D00693]|uniref:PD40 domain-containing protein n=1 Tax=Conexibacter sp. SYSU D00693 TaxID=2812560 RepID=UPI00196A750A|nr:PD40 domain-containing protein [Conexibacter sp. SYSU D00693]